LINTTVDKYVKGMLFSKAVTGTFVTGTKAEISRVKKLGMIDDITSEINERK
jgi:hypothetical protein